MCYRDVERRLEALEAAALPFDDTARFMVDISGDEARYFIDGVEVSQAEYAARMPWGPFFVDNGDDDAAEP